MTTPKGPAAVNELSLATTLQACRHCGQESTDEFCCAGCKTVFALLHEKGLGSFYDKKQDERLLPVDSEWLARDWSRIVVDENVEMLRFHVDGLSCSACVWILERLEQVSPLIEWSRLDMSRSVLIVKRKTGAPFAAVAKAVSELGFKIELLESESDQESRLRNENRRELIRVGVVGALTGNIMIFSVSMYGGATGDFATGFKILMGLLSLPVVTWGAAPLYRNTWTALKNRQISLDFPIALAVLSGAIAGWIGIFSGLDTLFFDSVSMLVLLLQGSRTALRFLRQKLDPAEDRLPLWMHESVQSPDGKVLSPADLTAGRHFRALKFNRLPVDARVMSREIEWDFSVLNGESRPVILPLGSEIPAGARLLSESAELETLRAASESRIAKLVRDWREGPRTRPSMTALADRVGQVFTIVVLAVAAFVIAFVDDGWMRALTLLVVSCPCVFGIAIPFAEAMAMKRAQE
ncbi:MAG: heavy metal translocating P-type ATPase metal-binding domain-containing protein, partial [Bdellovibrionaceae bacterium]|nr:heavy metal translocating P-type ATPase metal-binding domain-containing protein [Pseudobdellovibrionaceae bacterium]